VMRLKITLKPNELCIKNSSNIHPIKMLNLYIGPLIPIL
jgi:hypothetical protein